VIVLDVKVGSGAFMRTPAEARELAETMVAIGRANGRDTAAYVTDMSQPLGRAVGNALEVAEAVETLRGEGPADLTHLAVALAGEILARAGATLSRAAGERLAEGAIRDGSGLDKLAAMVRAQGGDERHVRDPDLLPRAPLQLPFAATADGLVARLDARLVAQASLALGAGRERKGDRIDPAVGVRLEAKVGERVRRGQTLAVVHAADSGRAEAASAILAEASRVAEEAVPIAPLIHWRSD
jgi:thymidine phosphorylase